MSTPARTVVIVPTFNEAETLPSTLAGTRTTVPSADVLVVDDASPDGTGDLADRLAAGDPQVHVLHRARKEGLGRAYVDGFGWALRRGYELVVEMDADGSHRPEDLRTLLARAHRNDRPDLVLGSRWVSGGAVLNWPRHRQVLSRAGNLYARLSMGLPLHDATGGFRVYRAEALRRLPLPQVQSQGYCFQVDMAFRLHRAGAHLVEVPITFVERSHGTSKMTRSIVLEALWRTTAWGVQHRLRQLRGRAHDDGPAAR